MTGSRNPISARDPRATGMTSGSPSVDPSSFSPALLYVPYAVGAQVKFRVATRDDHPIAMTVEPVLAAATPPWHATTRPITP